MEEANIKVIEEVLKDYIKQRAIEHSEKYMDRHKKVAYDSYLAGMEAMSEILEKR